MARRQRSRTQLGTMDRLELFERRASELGNLRFVQSGLQSKFNIAWDVESGFLRYRSVEPDEEDLRSFILLFRHFISRSEPVFIDLLFNDCFRFLTDNELRKRVEQARDVWRREIKTGVMGIVVDGVDLTPEYVLDLWINGEYFHNDPDKASELRNLLAQPLPLARMQFLSALPVLTRIILYMGRVVAHGLEEGLFQIPQDST